MGAGMSTSHKTITHMELKLACPIDPYWPRLVGTKSDSFGDIDLSVYIMHIQKYFGDFHGGTSLPLGRSA
jgi:hypothetical protein